jgi:hypothetical protein
VELVDQIKVKERSATVVMSARSRCRSWVVQVQEIQLIRSLVDVALVALQQSQAQTSASLVALE